jgi:hypothetical protein
MAIVPFLVAFFTIPIGEVVVIGALHFTAPRILILVALGRRLFFTQRDKYPGGIKTLDWFVIGWSISYVIAFFLQFPGQAALVQDLGTLVDTMGGYLVVRSFIPDGETVQRAVKTLAVICVVVAVFMINEQINHYNVFGLIGGIGPVVTIRDGKIRSEGVMGCLYEGAFSGALIPLFLSLWMERKSRLVAVAGILGATVMVFTSNSSTSILTIAGGLFALAFWKLRKKMRTIRWGLALTLIGLQIVMKAPVWALIARIDLTGSSSSYQRYGIVDMTIRNFRSWWLIGTPDYVNWGWDSWDLCNQFAVVALTGGLVALIFYIAIFKQSFGAIGNARKRVDGNRRQEWLLWCFGSALFATTVAHFGINYPAQLIVSLLTLVACISAVTLESRNPAVETARLPAKKWIAWAPLNAEPDAAVYEAEPLVHQRDPFGGSAEQTIPWAKA